MRFRNSDRNPRWRTLLIVLATALIVAPAAAFASNSFTDVADSDFFHDAVDWMADNGVTVGCNPPDNTRYCPNEAVTRGEMAVFLERLDTENVFLRPGEAPDGSGGDAETLDGKDSTDFLGANEQAVDADKLDGFDASSLVRSVSTTVNNVASDTNGTALAVTLTAPTSGTVSVSGLLELFNNSAAEAEYICQIDLNGSKTPTGVEFTVEVSADQVDTQCAAQSTFAVAAGTHDIELVVSGLGGTDVIGDASLNALFTPFQGDGTQATP